MSRQYGDLNCDGSTPFYMGGCLGRRMFFLDHHGTLRGVTYRAPWVDGENVAVCYNAKFTPDLAAKPRPVYLYDSGGWGFPDTDGEPGVLPMWRATPCDGLDPKCGCGFYAYHQGTIKYAAQGPGLRVEGIVEAYGKMVVGPLGYRAQKARIKAILVPWSPTSAYAEALRLQYRRAIKDLEQVRDTYRRRYSRRSVAYAASAIILALNGSLASFGVAAALATLAAITQIEHREFKSKWTDYHEADVENLRHALESIPDNYDDAIQEMIRRYPSVRFFVDRAKMEEEFPIQSLEHLVEESTEEEE